MKKITTFAKNGSYEVPHPGDTFNPSGIANLFSGKGGNNALSAGVQSDIGLLGDAGTLSMTARGGNDRLISEGNSNNNLYGDALTMLNDSKGGNDTLIAQGGSNNTLYGDMVMPE